MDAAPGQAHYLGPVMRRSAGDPVRLFNGIDGEWSARIASIRRDRATFAVEICERPQAPDSDIWLLFAPLRREPSELVVQKATELGVERILTVNTEHTNAARLNASRLAAIAVEAAEQCERLTVPDITPMIGLAPLLLAWRPERTIVAAVERRAVAPLRPHPGPAALLVGPEGGFTGAELDAFDRTPFVLPASLGPRILRAETAAIVGLARLMAPPGG